MPLIVGVSGGQSKMKGTVLKLPVLPDSAVKKGDLLQYSYQATDPIDTFISSEAPTYTGNFWQACYLPWCDKIFVAHTANGILMGRLLSHESSEISASTPTVLYSDMGNHSASWIFRPTILSGNRILLGLRVTNAYYLLVVTVNSEELIPGEVVATESLDRYAFCPGEGVEVSDGVVLLSAVTTTNGALIAKLISVKGTTITSLQNYVVGSSSGTDFDYTYPPCIIPLKNGNYLVVGTTKSKSRRGAVFSFANNAVSLVVNADNITGSTQRTGACTGYLKLKSGAIMEQGSHEQSVRNDRIVGHIDQGENALVFNGMRSLGGNEDSCVENVCGATLAALPGNGIVMVSNLGGPTGTSGRLTLCCVLCSTDAGNCIDHTKTVICNDESSGSNRLVANFSDGTVCIFHKCQTSGGFAVCSFQPCFVAPSKNIIHGIALSNANGGETVSVLIPNYNKEA